MGFMTEVSILNDRWDEIRENPAAFVDQIYTASMSGNSPDSIYGKYVIGQTTVAPTHHADDIRVYFSGRNSFFDAYPARDISMDRLKHNLKYLKEMRGYIKVAEQATKKAIAEGEENA